jgi:CBS domain-containing protein
MPQLAEIMTRDVHTVSPQTSVSEAAAAMVRGRFGSAVVLTGSALVGIFTERDVLRAAASGRDLAREALAYCCTPDPVVCAGVALIEDAAELMLGQGFRHLPVVDGSTLAGIVSLRDLLSARIRRT